MDQLPARQPVLALPMDRGRLAARAVGAPHRRDRLAGGSPGDLSRPLATAPDDSNRATRRSRRHRNHIQRAHAQQAPRLTRTIRTNARITPWPKTGTGGAGRPVLRPLLTSARSARTLRCEPSARRQRQHNRHPGRPPRIRTTTFPLRPPRLRDDPVGGDGLYLLEQAHPDRPAFYAVRVPRCRVSPRASFPPRLTTVNGIRKLIHFWQLPPARS